MRKNLLCLLSLTGVAFSADAAMKICNRAGQTINIGQGTYYVAKSGQYIYESRGHRVIKDGTCHEVSPFSTQRMWFRGMGEVDGVWDGQQENAPSRTFCTVLDDRYILDERAIPDVHTSETVCAAQRGVLKRHLEAKGETESSDHTLYFTKAPEEPANKPPKKDPKPYPKPDRDPIPPDTSGTKETTYGPNS